MSEDPRRYVADAIRYADRIAGRSDLASEHAKCAAAGFLKDLDAARTPLALGLRREFGNPRG